MMISLLTACGILGVAALISLGLRSDQPPAARRFGDDERFAWRMQRMQSMPSDGEPS